VSGCPGAARCITTWSWRSRVPRRSSKHRTRTGAAQQLQRSNREHRRPTRCAAGLGSECRLGWLVARDAFTCGACCSADGRGQQSCSSQQKTLQAAGPQALTLGPQGRAALCHAGLCVLGRSRAGNGEGGTPAPPAKPLGRTRTRPRPCSSGNTVGRRGQRQRPAAAAMCSSAADASSQQISGHPACDQQRAAAAGGAVVAAHSRRRGPSTCAVVCNPLGSLFACGNVARMSGLLMKGGRGRSCGCMGGHACEAAGAAAEGGGEGGGGGWPLAQGDPGRRMLEVDSPRACLQHLTGWLHALRSCCGLRMGSVQQLINQASPA
jgi:hypothetical protein